jgi:hypothetical protein
VDLPAHGVTAPRPVSLRCTAPAGPVSLEVEVRGRAPALGMRRRGQVLGGNSYPVRVVTHPVAGQVPVAVLGESPARGTLVGSGAVISDVADADPGRELLVIGEQSLSDEAAGIATSWLGRGGHVLLLAQSEPGPLALPGSLRLASLATAWGSTPFVFTGSAAELASLPPGAVWASELLSAAPEYVYTDIGDGPFAPETAVGVLKPPPRELLATVIGRVRGERGLLTVCQLPLAEAAQGGDPLAAAILGDLLCWARPLGVREHHLEGVAGGDGGGPERRG